MSFLEKLLGIIGGIAIVVLAVWKIGQTGNWGGKILLGIIALLGIIIALFSLLTAIAKLFDHR